MMKALLLIVVPSILSIHHSNVFGGPDSIMTWNIFVFGYSNVAYIPSATILNEGGYEGATSQIAKGLPGPWASNIESVILREVMKLTEHLGIQITSGTGE